MKKKPIIRVNFVIKNSNFPKKIQKRLFTIFLFLIEQKKVTKALTFKNFNLKNKILKFLFHKNLKVNTAFIKNLVKAFNIKFNFFKLEIFHILVKTVTLFKLLFKEKTKITSFYTKISHRCGIVKAYINFTNIFIILTNLKGEVKNWVSAGTGKFKKKRERTTPQVPISLCLRTSNVIRRKKLGFIKIVIAGPSKKFKSRVYYTLLNRSWIRRYQVRCLEEFYPKAYNGCRMAREKRR